MRLIARRADAVTDFGDARLWTETTRVDLLVAEVPNPRPGDRIEINGDAFLIRGEPVRDRERLVWSNAPVIVGAHDTGPLIRSKNGFWLAIPTQAAGKSTRGCRACWWRKVG